MASKLLLYERYICLRHKIYMRINASDYIRYTCYAGFTIQICEAFFFQPIALLNKISPFFSKQM